MSRPRRAGPAVGGRCYLYWGDLGCLDADGYLFIVFIVDRKKDMIIRAG